MRRSASGSGRIVEEGYGSRRTSHSDEDEEALRWAAIEKLPTYDRLRTSILMNFVEQHGQSPHGGSKEVDVRKLNMKEKQETNLLEDSDSEQDVNQLTINEHYAKAFEYRKEREELAKR